MSVQRTRTRNFIGASVAVCLLFSALIFGLSSARPAVAIAATAAASESDNFVIRVIPRITDETSISLIKKHLGEGDFLSSYKIDLIGNFPIPQQMLSKASIANIKEAVQNEIPSSKVAVDYITYNNERWSWTPSDEQKNPADSTNKAMDIIHAAGYKSAVSPHLTLLTQELNGVNWKKVDFLNLQLQTVVGEPQFKEIVQKVSSVAKQQNPDIIITAQVNPKYDTIPEIISALKSVRGDIDGVSIIWALNNPTTLDKLFTDLAIFETDDTPTPTDNPPKITGISGSPNSPTSSQKVTFTASANDDSRLSSIEIFVDSASLQPCMISAGNTGTCTREGGPYAAGSTHKYHVQAKDISGKITASSTGTFNVQATTQTPEEGMNSLLFRPGSAAVNQETFDIYAQHITAEDHIGTYEPRNNWQYVKQLAESSGAEIYIGYEPFLKAQSKSKMDSKWPGTKWVMLDIEGERYSNPAIAQKTIREAAARVHNADLKFITNVGSPTNSDEGNIKEFARVSDALIIQVMGMQDSPVKFKEFVIEKVGWARAANPDIAIYIGPSVSFRGTNDQYREPAYVEELVDSVRDKVDGVHYFYGTPDEGTPKDTLPRLKKLMELLSD